MPGCHQNINLHAFLGKVALLFVSILGLLLMGSYGAPLQAQTAMQGSGMDMNSMKAQM